MSVRLQGIIIGVLCLMVIMRLVGWMWLAMEHHAPAPEH
jgi:hypothetical protein